MEAVLLKVVVTGLWVLLTGTIGLFLGKKGKPYGKGKLIVHVILLIFVLAGWISCFYELLGIDQPKTGAFVFLCIFGITILTNLVSGVIMIASKELLKTLPITHKISTTVMLLSIVGTALALVIKF